LVSKWISEVAIGKSIRVLCVDDHAVVRDGLALIIDSQPDMAVIASAGTGQQAVALCQQHRPDITLMDLELPGMSGVEAIRTITRQFADARIIVLTVHAGNEDIFRALQAGAATYLLKDMLTKDLIGVIREVHAGGRPMRPEITARLKERAGQAPLTEREVEVLQLMALGLANREIAKALEISDQTVHAHIKNIFSKLDVGDRTSAVTTSATRGIIHLR
jgi:DNA-binding NarL/FixJ family response regulator